MLTVVVLGVTRTGFGFFGPRHPPPGLFVVGGDGGAASWRSVFRFGGFAVYPVKVFGALEAGTAP